MTDASAATSGSSLTGMRRRSMLRPRPHIGGASSRTGLAALAVFLVIFFDHQAGNFVTYANLTAILVNASSVILVSVAVARLLIAGSIDLSVGGAYALIAVVCASVARDSGSALLAVTVAVTLGAAIGAANGTLVRLLRISPIIVTLALMAIYQGMALVFSNASSIHGLPESFLVMGRSRLLDVPTPVVVSLIWFAVGAFLLTRTAGGLRSYALGGDAMASRYAGINVERHRLWLFVYAGVSVGLVAALSSARLGAGSPTLGANFEFDVLTAVILGGVGFAGGTGRPIGVLVGAITISVVNAGMVFVGVTNFYQQVAKGAILLLALGADQLLANRKRKGRAATGSSRRNGAARSSEPAAMPRKLPPDDLPVVLSAERLRKSYGAVVAASDLSFEARAGEVLCLVGDNGAGKSTVIKMLSGVEKPDRGVVRLDGRPVSLTNPADAHGRGIETVHQNLGLCPNLGAAYNLALGREPKRSWLGIPLTLHRRACIAEARRRLGQLGIQIDDLLRPVAEFSGGQRQAVAIARVVQLDAKVVILDEPTASLGVRQTETVLQLARALAEGGVAVIMVTHDVESVLKVSDRVVVLSLGSVLHVGTTEDLTDRDLVQLMAGIPIDRPASQGAQSAQ